VIYWIEWVTVISVGTMGCNAACSPSSCYTLCDKDVRLTRDKGKRC